MDRKRELELVRKHDTANRQHLADWKEAKKALHNFYFTFGTDPLYPYGSDDFVLIQCNSADEACKLFMALHPNRPGSSVMNCAFMYGQDEWDNHVSQYYKGREPVEIITVYKTGSH